MNATYNTSLVPSGRILFIVLGHTNNFWHSHSVDFSKCL